MNLVVEAAHYKKSKHSNYFISSTTVGMKYRLLTYFFVFESQPKSRNHTLFVLYQKNVKKV